MKYFILLLFLSSFTLQGQISNPQAQQQSDFQLQFFMSKDFQKSLTHFDRLKKMMRSIPEENLKAALLAIEELEVLPNTDKNDLKQRKIELNKLIKSGSYNQTYESKPAALVVFEEDSVDTLPEYPGGIDKFYEFVADNMDYPDSARRYTISGEVHIEYVVMKNGDVDFVKVVRGIGYGCDEEAMRVIKQSPKWIPGYQGDDPVNVRMVLPIWFNSDPRD